MPEALERRFLAELVQFARDLGYEVAISREGIDDPIGHPAVTMHDLHRVHLCCRGDLDYWRRLFASLVLERETGSYVPSTNQPVELMYRLEHDG